MTHSSALYWAVQMTLGFIAARYYIIPKYREWSA